MYNSDALGSPFFGVRLCAETVRKTSTKVNRKSMTDMLSGEDMPPQSTPGFVAISKFTIANEMVVDVKKAFLERPHLVDHAPGFFRMEVISPIDQPAEIWLITYWQDESSFKVWHRSHEYHASHDRIPKGLKLVPKSWTVQHFEYVSS